VLVSHSDYYSYNKSTVKENIKLTIDELKQFNQEVSAISIKGMRLPQGVLNFSNFKAPTK